MTIVTKPLSDKKDEKNQEPLVEINVEIKKPEKSSPGANRNIGLRDIERLRPGYVVNRRKLPTYIGFSLFFSILLVLSTPFVANMLKNSVRAEFYHDWCTIPYDEPHMQSQIDSDGSFSLELDKSLFEMNKFARNMIAEKDKLGRFFREEFEIDETVEKITVPDFSGGKRSRFIHDFKTNKTGIIDLDGHRCFVMPLNRSAVLPPGGLMDLIKKMNNGYYDVDTSVLRETMRVVTPAVENRADLGSYIMTECYGYPIYKLEKYTSSVFKRSVGNEVKFVEFAGMGTHELNIVNYEELADQEVQGPIAMA